MGKTGFIAYDPHVARDYFDADVVTTIYYKKLLNCNDILDKDSEGFFTVTSETMEKFTCIKRRQQDRVRKWLEGRGYILTCLKIPADRTSPQVHFKIIDEKRIT